MTTTTTREGRLARALVAGFCATAAATLVFFAAYTLALSLGFLMPWADWVYYLAHNQLIDAVSSNIFAAVAVHLVVGIALAIAYALWVEPRTAMDPWKSGVLFSLIPWVLSLVVFFPLVGAGMLGWELGAGILPMVGNLVLHLCYGFTLGVTYGPVGERAVAENVTRKEERSHRLLLDHRAVSGARGLLIGTVAGILLAALIGLVVGAESLMIAGLPIGFFYVSMLLGGASMGLLVGLWLGIGGPERAVNV